MGDLLGADAVAEGVVFHELPLEFFEGNLLGGKTAPRDSVLDSELHGLLHD